MSRGHSHRRVPRTRTVLRCLVLVDKMVSLALVVDRLGAHVPETYYWLIRDPQGCGKNVFMFSSKLVFSS